MVESIVPVQPLQPQETQARVESGEEAFKRRQCSCLGTLYRSNGRIYSLRRGRNPSKKSQLPRRRVVDTILLWQNPSRLRLPGRLPGLFALSGKIGWIVHVLGQCE